MEKLCTPSVAPSNSRTAAGSSGNGYVVPVNTPSRVYSAPTRPASPSPKTRTVDSTTIGDSTTSRLRQDLATVVLSKTKTLLSVVKYNRLAGPEATANRYA